MLRKMMKNINISFEDITKCILNNYRSRILKKLVKSFISDIRNIINDKDRRKFRVAIFKARLADLLIERILNKIYNPIYFSLSDYLLKSTLIESDKEEYSLVEIEELLKIFPPGLYRAELRGVVRARKEKLAEV